MIAIERNPKWQEHYVLTNFFGDTQAKKSMVWLILIGFISFSSDWAKMELGVAVD